jgi:ribosomal protein S18 acetylase RimI-like enzyme
MPRGSAPLAAPPGYEVHMLGTGRGAQPIVDQLLAMEKKLWKKSESWGPMLEKELQRRNTFTLVATAVAATPADGPADAAVVGYLLFTATGLVAHISKVVVTPQARRQGIGRALVAAALEFAAAERRVGSVTLHVDAGNDPALALYRQFGFESEEMLEVS